MAHIDIAVNEMAELAMTTNGQKQSKTKRRKKSSASLA